MKQIYLLLMATLCANILFAQSPLNSSFSTSGKTLSLIDYTEPIFDTLPNGTVINLQNGEIVESGFTQNPFDKMHNKPKAVTKSARKTTSKAGYAARFSKNKLKTANLLNSAKQNNSSFQREKIDKMVYYTPGEMVPTYGLKLQETTKTIATRDGNGSDIERIEQILDEASRTYINSRKMEFTLNENGRPITTYISDWMDEKWTYSQKIDNDYHPNGEQILNEILRRNENEWENYSKTTNSFDTNGNRLSTIVYSVDQDKQWMIDRQYNYTYHTNWQQASYHFQGDWDADREKWLYVIKQEHNEEGNITLFLYRRMYPQDNDWRTYTKSEFIYLSNGNIEENTFVWDTNYQELVQISSQIYKDENTYKDDKLVEQIRFDLENDVFIQKWKRINAYDQWGNQILFEEYLFSQDGTWQLRKKWVREFIENGMLLIKNLQYRWDEGLNSIRENYLQLRELDSNGNIVSYIQSFWDSEIQAMSIKIKSRYSYPNDTEKIEEYYKYDILEQNKELVISESFTFSYDSVSGRYVGVKNEIPQYPQDNSISEFIYNDNLQLTKIIRCDENGVEKGTEEFFYDELGRDTFYTDNYLTIRTTYETIDDNKLLATEYRKEGINGTVENESKIINHWDNGMLLLSEHSYLDSENNSWTESYSTIYTYNEKGQILKMVNGNEKVEYTFQDGYLTMIEYFLSNEEWEIRRGKGVCMIDTTVTSNGIQNLPDVFTSYSWSLIFTYGKILEIVDYDIDEISGKFVESGKDIISYSPAAILSGDAIIEGYIFDESGATKSVTITSNKDGTPAEGVVVALCARENDFVLATDTTGTDGLYEFKGVPEGNFYLKVELDGYTQTSTYNIEVSWNETRFENKNFAIQDGEILTGITEKELGIWVYPNPAVTFVKIGSSDQLNSIRIIDISGRTRLIQQNIRTNKVDLNIENLRKGLYIFEIETKLNFYRKKILIQH